MLTPTATAGRDDTEMDVAPVFTVAGSISATPMLCVVTPTVGAMEAALADVVYVTPRTGRTAARGTPCTSMTPAGSTSVGLIGTPETFSIRAGVVAIDTPRTEATLGTTLM